ncbi:hypothetical protein [Luteolibacter pohnpeiensis]|nr:hypothetical protein [Luteolibacter pohnpeiensis]
MRLVDDAIEIKAAWSKLSLTPSEIIELRFYHFLFPRFVAITRTVDSYMLASFSVIDGSRLKDTLIDRGFTITNEAKWQPWTELSSDCERFGLSSGNA